MTFEEDSLVGQMLGQFEILESAGQGGMATVYRARQASVNRIVAIKVLPQNLLHSPGFLERFEREVNIVTHLEHPHIVPIYDYGHTANIPYIAMRYLGGGNLAHLIHQGAVPLNVIQKPFAQILEALAYAHAHAVVHRDIKPANMLLDESGNAYLGDFGIAHILDSELTITASTIGTPAYMSPEQARGEAVTYYSDIYSLGMVLFECLTGHRPFHAETPVAMMMQHINKEMPPLSQYRTDLPNALEKVINKATAKKAEDRFASVEEMAAAFHAAFDPLSVSIKVESKSNTAPSNPFFHRSAIRDQAYFVNRERETRQIRSLLDNGQSVSVIGQRRIGKTSLLFHIANLAAENQCFVYIDCGMLAELDPPGIYRALLEEINDALRIQLPHLDNILNDSQPITYRILDRMLREILAGGQKLVFLLDEFELMSHNPTLDPDFFSGLRALTARHSVAFVTASKSSLLELTYANASTLSSPFFNIFAAIPLGLFGENDARLLIHHLANMSGINFSTQDESHILNLAGSHPLFLQMAAYQAAELQQTSGTIDYTKLEQRFLSEAEQHFAYYWRSLSSREQELLAMLPATSKADLDTLRALEKKSLIVQQQNNFHCFSPAFQAYVRVQPLSNLIQADPVLIDPRRRHVILDGQTLNLSELQYDLLVYLSTRSGEVVTNEVLEKALWADEYVDDPERLKSVIKGVRRALGESADCLENVRGVGYMWRLSG